MPIQSSPPSHPSPPQLYKISYSLSSSQPALVDFLASTPPPITTLLVRFAPHASLFRRLLEAASWRGSWYDSWLCLAAWWGICLFTQQVLQYGLPCVFGLYVLYSHYRHGTKWRTLPVTEEMVQAATADLVAIQELLPQVPAIRASFDKVNTLRIIGVIYVPYLFITYFLSLRVLLGVVGSFALTWRAPWAQFIRTILVRNPLILRLANKLWVALTGSPLTSLTIQVIPAPQKGDSLRFMFTILENQRWWVGLDWTAALLPNERPSWCSSSLQPLSPPMVFELPEPMVALLPDKQSPTGRCKRIATWSWEESEWKVLLRQDGRTTRVERPLPREESGPNGSMLSKVANKMKDARPPSPSDETSGEVDATEWTTDNDGWVYGDNKWEKQSDKGGYGKYTRYRKWSRIAVVTEVVEPASDSDLVKLTATNLNANRHRRTGSIEESVSPKDKDIKNRLRVALEKPNKS